MKAIFVAGTDTGIGKTLITGLLARYLSMCGYRVVTQKWIQCGGERFPADIREHLKLMGRSRREIKKYLPLICPYILKFPASPHLAAKKEKRKIDPNIIKRAYRSLRRDFDYLIIEGTGGLLVPYHGKKLIIDIARELRLPVLLVAANKLGAINHTLLACEAIRKRKMKLFGIIFNAQKEKTDPCILKDNPQICKQITRENISGVLGRIRDTEKLYKQFVPIAKNIIRGPTSTTC